MKIGNYKEEIINSYIDGKNPFNIAEKFLCSYSAVYKLLQRSGVKLRPRLNLDEKEIIIGYLGGFSTIKLSKIHNCSNSKISKILHKNNILMRTAEERTKRISVNDTYFETIDTKDKAYFLGLIVADGSVNKNAFKIQLQEEDVDILNLFKKYIEYEGEVKFIKKATENRKNTGLLNIYSQKIAKDLIKLGVIPAKSHFTYFPDIPEEFHSHFIRGVFDGDGCVYIDKRSNSLKFSIIGNILLIEKIKQILIENCKVNNVKLEYNKIHTPNIVSISYYGNNNCERIYTWLYRDCEDLFLVRKRNKVNLIKTI